MSKKSKAGFRVLVAAWAGLALFAPRAEAAKQMQIALGGYTNRSEVLTNFPVLVVLSNNVGGSSSFTFDDFLSASGHDLRFYANPSDTGAGLDYEIESWNTNAGQACYVWVRVPTIPGDGSGSIYAKWGDSGNSGQLPCTTNGAVWTDGFVGVWHMAQTNATDSTKRGHDGTAVGSVVNTTGKIGNANEFDASADYITVPGSPDFTFAGDYSMSLWVYGHGKAGYEGLMGTHNGRGFVFARWNNADSGLAFLDAAWGTPPSSRAVTDNAWHLVGFTWHKATGRWRFYIDGVDVGTGINGNGAINSGTKNLNLANGGPDWLNGFDGILDEVRMESTLRSTNWMWACYMNQADNTVFNNYGAMTADVAASAPRIQNAAVTSVTTNSATFNGLLTSTGSSACAVCVLWGTDTNAWANTHWFNGGVANAAWTDNTPFSTNIALNPDTTYYYSYGASNVAMSVVATSPVSFITGALTVQATDPLGRTNASDTAAFTVARPSTCTNEDMVVNYSLGGTAIHGEDYTIAPASGTVVIAKGQTNGVITVTPVYRQSVTQTVILTLLPGFYASGDPHSATCTLALVDGPDRYWVASSPGNWSDTANWSFARGGPGGSSVPAATQNAIFDGGGSGNCTLNAAVNVLGLRLESGFAGAVIQTTDLVTIRNNGYHQAGGVFAGGTTNIVISGGTGTAFRLLGGVFTNTSATLTLARDATSDMTIPLTLLLYTNGVFAHNNGTLRLASEFGVRFKRIQKLDIRQPLTLHHLEYAGGKHAWDGDLEYTLELSGPGTLTVEGDFVMQRSATTPDTYTARANGGEITVLGNTTFGAGAMGGTTRLLLAGSGDQTYTVTDAGNAPRLAVNKPEGTAFAPAVGTTNLNARSFQLASGTFTAPPGVFSLADSRENNEYVITQFLYAAGTYLHNTGTLAFASSYHGRFTRTDTIRLERPLTLHHLLYAGGQRPWDGRLAYLLDFAGAGDLLVEGDFTLQRSGLTDGEFQADGEEIEVRGNVWAGPGAMGGTSRILLAGTNEQYLAQATNGTPPRGTWTIDKSGGQALLATDVALSGTGQDLIWTNGMLNLSSNTLTVGRNVAIGPGATTLDVTVADATTAGCLTATGTVSGIANADLKVTVTAKPADVEGSSYIVVSNGVELASAFGAVSWPPEWRGKVDYDGNGGKQVMLFDIAPVMAGTLILIR